MKTELAAECKKVFTEEMSKKDGYEVVEVAAPDVLILRPGLVNVEVNAPDLRRNVGATIVRSAGQMTLFLELWDSTSSTLLARVLDFQADIEGMAQRSSRVTNKAAADRILKDWARELRQHLEAAQGQLAED
jgi:RNase H-fold protein (predicted Holliday junction resolvase)